MIYYYHFVGSNLRDGRPVPADGEWLEHDGPLEMCESGLHASPTAWEALQYAPGSVLCLVEMDGIKQYEYYSDKVVGRGRRIIARFDATEMLRAYARQSALSVIHLWDAPAVVREYLETGDESKRGAATRAARDEGHILFNLAGGEIAEWAELAAEESASSSNDAADVVRTTLWYIQRAELLAMRLSFLKNLNPKIFLWRWYRMRAPTVKQFNDAVVAKFKEIEADKQEEIYERLSSFSKELKSKDIPIE